MFPRKEILSKNSRRVTAASMAVHPVPSKNPNAMTDSKNSRRAATGAEGSPEIVSKNSRRGISRKTGASAGDPSGATPSMPSKNSRRGTGAKIGVLEVPPSETPDGIELQADAPISEGAQVHGKAAATTLQEDERISPIAVGGVALSERQDDPKGSPASLAGVGGKNDQSGNRQPTPSRDAIRHDESDKPDISELSAKVESMKRQQRASALRGALLVFLPPVVLCLPFIILKGCKLLLLSWWWCFAPLLLWAIPVASILSIFVRCYRLFRQQEGKDKEATAQEAERG